MRLRSIVKIDSTEYTIKELTTKEIISLLSDSEVSDKKEETSPSIEENLFGFGPLLDKMIERAFDNNVKRKDLIDLAPSELKVLYDAFMEVNSTFFDVARALKMDEALKKITGRLVSSFSTSDAVLSKPAI